MGVVTFFIQATEDRVLFVTAAGKTSQVVPSLCAAREA